ncbi:hypothetical protein ACFQ4N_09410 [Oceanobacillus iheyensis]|uniref:hypothetical protein n=1 Tax=Oceanobacillus iheyensis TaxID=182710 RepID=UPI003637BAB1
MTFKNNFQLEMFNNRFNDIMNNHPELKQKRVEMLVEDVEMVFDLPQEKVHPEIASFYKEIKQAV